MQVTHPDAGRWTDRLSGCSWALNWQVWALTGVQEMQRCDQGQSTCHQPSEDGQHQAICQLQLAFHLGQRRSLRCLPQRLPVSSTHNGQGHQQTQRQVPSSRRCILHLDMISKNVHAVWLHSLCCKSCQDPHNQGRPAKQGGFLSTAWQQLGPRPGRCVASCSVCSCAWRAAGC